MKNALTSDDLFAYIVMLGQVDHRPVVLVEGSEDSAIMDAHALDEHIQIMPGYGKQSVLGAAKLLFSAGVTRVICLVDSDLDHLFDAALSDPPNVVRSENHDFLADLLFACPELTQAIIRNFAQVEEADAYLAHESLTVEALLVGIAGMIGAMRATSIRHGLGISMARFPTPPLIDAFESGTLEAQILTISIGRSPADVSPALVADHLHAEIVDAGSLVSYSSGHDLLSALGSLVMTRWGGVGAPVIARAFRAAVACRCFSRTRFFGAVAAWGTGLGISTWDCLEPVMHERG